MVYIITGVSGCGKTTIGKLLAEKLTIPFYDADNFHPAENIFKMKNGIPLVDEDRLPWLKSIADEIPVWEKNGGGVLACSALKQIYRDILKVLPAEKMTWINLAGSYEQIRHRLEERNGHFFSTNLLQSQFDTLEPINEGLEIEISSSPNEIINEILSYL